MKIEFTLNGQPVAVETLAHITLLHLLREHLGLTGSKPGCEVGECGACSVILDGRAVNACQLLAPQVHGREVITIEGLTAPDGGPSDLQLAFLEFGAVQCGYCTPGMVLSAKSLLDRVPEPSEAQITEALSGNLCRCTGYGKIVKAVKRAALSSAGREARGQQGERR